ncbi:MAG: alkaline phosphatase [Spirochaetaceae bacterium]|nr:alkaline phosphatase [Spirochaetaceae bacterium]
MEMFNNRKHLFASLAKALGIFTLFILLFLQGFEKVQAEGRRETSTTEEQTVVEKQGKTPKYVFLFIGDGMSYAQVQSTAFFLGKDAGDKVSVVQKSDDPSLSPKASKLAFMDFPAAGSAQTYDATSFAPDSASTATSILTGYKTHSGSINVDTTKKNTYPTIAEQLKAQKNWKIGVISTVNLNHATPAAVYAHQASRSYNYPIGLELVKSGFDFFAGGALMDPTDKNKDKESIYDLAKKAGYTVALTQKEAQLLTPQNNPKSIIIGEKLADANSLPYEIDREDGDWALKDYVKKGIEMLDNDTGFFMMIESGKIDWACHANDAAATIHDTAAFNDSIEEALSFYNKHPEETLIIVTADHETGGLSIGFAGTNYDTYLDNLENQKISYAQFDKQYAASYKANKTPLADIMKDVELLFGLVTEESASLKETSGSPVKNKTLILTSFEMDRIKAAYDKTMSSTSKERNQDEYVMYGSYEPLTVTITNILNNKSGIAFTSYSHTGLPVPVFAKGIGSQEFAGYYDNTDIYKKLASLTKVIK